MPVTDTKKHQTLVLSSKLQHAAALSCSYLDTLHFYILNTNKKHILMEIVKNKWLNITIGVVLLSTAIVIALFIKDKIDEKKKEHAVVKPIAG